jgi:hypothetical protein
MNAHAVVLSAVVSALLLASPQQASAGEQSRLNSEITELRLATVPFHSLSNAIDAGWDEDLTGCLALPGVGGMGHHYVNWDIFFDGVVDAVQPELLVYVPTPNGGLKLGAVEYIVPASTLTGPVPELFGQTFHYNPNVQAWVLHVWLWHGNPDGLFADWNPNVSCD